MLPRIALTSGEPAGIGPDVCLSLAARQLDCDLVCLGDREMLAGRAQALGLKVALRPYDRTSRRHIPGTLVVAHHPLLTPAVAGRLEPRNSPYVVHLLERASDGARSGEFAAIATAPVHKSAINDAGIPFTGHTEFFAARTGAPRPVMMLATRSLRVALATTHLPLASVSAAITGDLLCEVLEILNRDLTRWWGIARPRIAVCGLNPHAGESGHLGDEETRVIAPAIARMRERGLRLAGPLPADTVFVPRVLADFDVVLAMYHDQGLPVIKHAGFETAVNVTLGLPILRTSVDHGTALELAGTGRADASSMVAAVDLAAQGRRPLRVVGNLPYNISTPLLFHLLQSVGDIQDMHVMLQREVVARMAAHAGDAAYGRLTVMLSPWVEIERLFDVGPGAFQPPPQVWSAVARLVVRATPAFAPCPAFPAVVAAAFSHRRKTLRNALRGLATAEQIEGSGVDPSARPETVSPVLFNAIASKVKLSPG